MSVIYLLGTVLIVNPDTNSNDSWMVIFCSLVFYLYPLKICARFPSPPPPPQKKENYVYTFTIFEFTFRTCREIRYYKIIINASELENLTVNYRSLDPVRDNCCMGTRIGESIPVRFNFGLGVSPCGILH